MTRLSIHSLQRHAHVPTTFSLWLWPAEASDSGGQFDTLYRKSLTAQLFQLLLWTTDPSPSSPIRNAILARLAAHGLSYHMDCSPLFLPPASRPPPRCLSTKRRTRHLTFCETLYAHCYLLGIQLNSSTPPRLLPKFSPRLPNSAPPLLLRTLCQSAADQKLIFPHLASRDLLFVSDILDSTSGHPLSYNELRGRHCLGPKKRPSTSTPAWFSRLLQLILAETPNPQPPLCARHTTTYGTLAPTPILMPPTPSPAPQRPPIDGEPRSTTAQDRTTIYTDGSRLKTADGDYRTGFATIVTAGPFLDPTNRAMSTHADPSQVASLDPDNLPAGTLWGSCFGTSPLCDEDNYAAEIVAVLAGYLHTPDDDFHLILSDNEPVTMVAHSFPDKKRRAQLKLKHHNLFRALNFLRAYRPSILLRHVRAHVGIHGNELADRLAKAAARDDPAPLPHTPPSALALEQLVSLCSFPISVTFYPVEVASIDTKMSFTTRVVGHGDGTHQPYTPSGYFARTLRSRFHALASELFARTSSRGMALRALDKSQVDKPLWYRMLQGRNPTGSYRHTQANCIKFANTLHISLEALDKRNPAWYEFRSRFPPPPHAAVPPPISPGDPRTQVIHNFHHHAQTCPACDQFMTLS